MRTREQEIEPLVNLSEISEIELIILRRMREFTIGEHRSQFHGNGFDFVGLRDWQAGDRFSSIDWPQSTLTNFSPMIVRDFEQPSTAAVVAVADASLSTRCGAGGILIASAIARAIAIMGLSAVFFQDLFGLITFDGGFQRLNALPTQVGKKQVIHALDAYERETGLQELRHAETLSMTIASFMRKTSLIPVVSDFLFPDYANVIGELARLNVAHDVFLVMIDSAFAFELPRVSAGWVETYDIETGRSRVLSRRAMAHLGDRANAWQDEVERTAKDADLDVLRLPIDETRSTIALTEFIAERRLRKT